MNAVYGAGAERPLLFTSGDALNLWWNTQCSPTFSRGRRPSLILPEIEDACGGILGCPSVLSPRRDAHSRRGSGVFYGAARLGAEPRLGSFVISRRHRRWQSSARRPWGRAHAD